MPDAENVSLNALPIIKNTKRAVFCFGCKIEAAFHSHFTWTGRCKFYLGDETDTSDSTKEDIVGPVMQILFKH